MNWKQKNVFDYIRKRGVLMRVFDWKARNINVRSYGICIPNYI